MQLTKRLTSMNDVKRIICCTKDEFIAFKALNKFKFKSLTEAVNSPISQYKRIFELLSKDFYNGLDYVQVMKKYVRENIEVEEKL